MSNESIEILENKEFGHIKTTADLIKKIKGGIEKVQKGGDLDILDKIKVDLDSALTHLREFTKEINEERCVIEDIKENAKEILKHI